jgi:hypothetical protein
MISDCHNRKSKIAGPFRQSKIENPKLAAARQSKIANPKWPVLLLPLAFTPQQRYNRRSNFERSVSHV